MSQANEDRAVKELLAKYKGIDKHSYIRNNTGWNDEKVIRVLKRYEEAQKDAK